MVRVGHGERSRGRTGPGLLTVLAVVLLAWFLPPAAVASVAGPRVIAVHTGSGSEVMVLETAALPSSADLSADELSVTVGGRPVPTTITPLASNSLSVVLVVDTSAGMAPDDGGRAERRHGIPAAAARRRAERRRRLRRLGALGRAIGIRAGRRALRGQRTAYRR